jgi:hypothetical protein
VRTVAPMPLSKTPYISTMASYMSYMATCRSDNVTDSSIALVALFGFMPS